jgi:hypothetical protein
MSEKVEAFYWPSHKITGHRSVYISLSPMFVNVGVAGVSGTPKRPIFNGQEIKEETLVIK